MRTNKIIIDNMGNVFAPVGRVSGGYVYDDRERVIGRYVDDRVESVNRHIIGFAAGGAIMNPTGKQVARLNNRSEIESSKTLRPGEYAAVYNFFFKEIK